MINAYFIVKLSSTGCSTSDGSGWDMKEVMIPMKVGEHLIKIFGKEVLKRQVENLKPSDFEEE